MGEMVMLTVDAMTCTPPTIERLAEKMSLPLEAFDESFGVIAIDPDRNLYAVRVDGDMLPEEVPEESGVSGPFADPKIAPFGTPVSE